MNFDKFKEAAEAWRKEHCSSPGAARAKLVEMGFINEDGTPTPEYAPDPLYPRRVFFALR